MGNISNFKENVERYRRAVEDANREREQALAVIDGYEGPRAESERELIEKDYADAIGHAREGARVEFSVILGRMKRKAASVGEVMEPPSPSQVNLLKTLEMRKSISATEARAAAKALAGNDIGLATLAELCESRGGVIVPEVAGAKSSSQKAADALREFEDAANVVLAWKGGTRAELMMQRNRQLTAHVPANSRVSMDEAIAADLISSDLTATEFVQKIIGHSATVEGANLID